MYINNNKLKIYKFFNGDIDAFAQLGNLQQKSIITEKEWSLIDNLIQDLIIIKNGLASDSYACQLEKRLKDICDSKETIQELKNFAQGFSK